MSYFCSQQVQYSENNCRGRAFCYFLNLITTCLSKKITWKQPSVIKLKSIIVDSHMNVRDTWSMFTLQQPILAKKNCDISKFQLFKKITIFLNILNIKRLYLDCICHFRGTSHTHRLTWLCSILSGNYCQLQRKQNKHLVIERFV